MISVSGLTLRFGKKVLFESVTLKFRPGLVYGIIATWRGNLRSVMIAHFLQDAITGTVIYMRHH